MDISDIPEQDVAVVVPLNANVGLWLFVIVIAAVGATFAALNPDVWWPWASQWVLVTQATITRLVQALVTLVHSP